MCNVLSAQMFAQGDMEAQGERPKHCLGGTEILGKSYAKIRKDEN